MKWKTRWVDTFKNRAQNKIKTSLLSSLLDHASVSNVGCTSSKASACLFFGKASRLWSHHSLQGCRVTLQEHILISLIKSIQFTIKQRLTWKVGPRSCIILQRMLAISLGHQITRVSIRIAHCDTKQVLYLCHPNVSSGDCRQPGPIHWTAIKPAKSRVPSFLKN